MANIRVAVIILNKKKILLIRRIKNGKEYFVLPGGGVENKEDIFKAAKREIKEETGLNIKSIQKMFKFFNKTDKRFHYCFLTNTYSGKLKLGGPEKKRASLLNQYFLEWHNLQDISSLNILPRQIKSFIRFVGAKAPSTPTKVG